MKSARVAADEITTALCDPLQGWKIRTARWMSERVLSLETNMGIFVAKLFVGTSWRRCFVEAAALRAAADCLGANVPSVFAVGQCRETCGFVVRAPVSGTTLTATSGARTLEQSMGVLGRVLGVFHAYSSPGGFGEILNRSEGSESKFVAQRVANLRASLLAKGQVHLAAILEDMQTSTVHHYDDRPGVFCHGDLHFDNVLVMKEAQCQTQPVLSGVIDFESACYGPAEFDLAKTRVVCSEGTLVPISIVLNDYASRNDLRHELIEKLTVFHVLDGWLHAALIEGRDVRLWRGRLNALVAQS